MRKATILFNPNSGRKGKSRDRELDIAIGIIQSAGVHTELTVCRSSHEATIHTRYAVAGGSDTVFACGGDGTIHDVIQELAGTPVALAILPFGTANALAHDLRLPSRPSAAARAAVNGTVRRIPLGRVEYEDLHGKPAARYFTVAAGIGVDAHLFYKLTAEIKNRCGMAAYYLKAWQLWATYRMRRFEVEYSNGTGVKHTLTLPNSWPSASASSATFCANSSPGRISIALTFALSCAAPTAATPICSMWRARSSDGERKIAGIDLVSCSEIACRFPRKAMRRARLCRSRRRTSRPPCRRVCRFRQDALSLVVPAAKN